MIGAVFLRRRPVGWLGRHIRMDVVVSLLPPPRTHGIRAFLRSGDDRDLHHGSPIFAWPVMTMLAELDQRSAVGQYPAGHPASGRCRSG